MSQLRQNLATGEWVVISPERLKDRQLISQPNALLDSIPAYAENCPFCPRNAHRFENIEIASVPHPDPANSARSPWLAHTIENKFKIFHEDSTCHVQPVEFRHEGIYNSFMNCGRHELVVESPIHNETYATMSPNGVKAVVRMFIDRLNAIRGNPHHLQTIVFKNHGSRSGASQIHSHSQIVSMHVVPNFIRFLLEEAQRYFDSHGICVFCKMIAYELDQDVRIVYRNRSFVSYIPYAAATPYEINIFPLAHESLFGDMSEDGVTDLADCLQQTMGKLYLALSNPDFNFILRNPPHSLSAVPFYHWHIQVVPHLKSPGGFELGSRVSVNEVVPEEAAAHLRHTDTSSLRPSST
ncbi:MAG: DUF4931 domain-containing protein [Chloroflexi bacterium]|nr:DUF4931 domain-containing protein [Chloroflexota bacterium]